MKKIIKIFLENTNAPLSQLKSLYEVDHLVKKNEPLIYTNCTNFFSFHYLEKGYEVFAIKANGDYLSLSEILSNTKEHCYTNKEVRRAHNASKMLLAGSFNFRKNIKEKIKDF